MPMVEEADSSEVELSADHLNLSSELEKIEHWLQVTQET